MRAFLSSALNVLAIAGLFLLVILTSVFRFSRELKPVAAGQKQNGIGQFSPNYAFADAPAQGGECSSGGESGCECAGAGEGAGEGGGEGC